VVRIRNMLVTGLLVMFAATVVVAQTGDGTESELLSLIHEIAAARNELAEMEERVLTEGSDDLLEDELLNYAFEQRIQDLGEKLLDIEGRFLADEKAGLLEEALSVPSTNERQLAALRLLRIEEMIALAKGEIAAAWQESGLIQQKLTLELKRDIEEALSNMPPEAFFEQEPVASNTPIQLIDQSNDPDGEIVKWRWDFNDGTTADVPNPTHVFDEPGPHQVTLEVTDDKGATARITRTIEVLPSPPIACIDAPLEAPVGAEIPFLDCSSDPDGDIVTWNWIFGEGSESAETNPVHMFNEPGMYTVELRVIDDQDLSDTTEHQIRILPATGSLQVVLSDEAQAQRGRLPKDILLVLDLSSSMKEPFEGSTKIAIAKEVIRDVLESLPQGAEVGLRTFHRCGQSELEVPIQPLHEGVFLEVLKDLATYGTTPLAHTIRQIPGDLAGREGPHLIIFVTDGIETCDEDPVAAAEQLAESGVDIIFRLVGYNILYRAGQTARVQLQAISEAMDGSYTDVSTKAQLAETLRLGLPLVYRILDSSGTAVWEGVVGEAPVELPHGTYSIVVETEPQLVIDEFTVGPGEQLTITVSPE